MALIKMSSIGITAISGKAGGSVYSRNRGGEYVKNFVMPTNTITAARQAVRAVFGALASGWRTLTQEQRNSWVEAAPLYLRTNAFGDQKQLQPNALFVGQNQTLVNADLPMIQTITAPQGTNGVIDMSTNVYDVGAGDVWNFTFGLEEDQSNLDTPNEYVIEAAPPHSASKRNVENQFRKLRSTAGAFGATPLAQALVASDFDNAADDLKSVYEAKFGTPQAGDIVSFRVYAVNPDTGERSAYFYANATVASS